MKKVGILVLLFAPTLAFAAGFAQQPLFLSHTPVTEGQSVHIYAVLTNNDNVPFSGSVVFYDGTTKLGAVAESLAAGSSVTASILWTPSAGTHAVKADIVGKDSTVNEEINETFTIAAKPKPQTTTAATSSVAQQYAAATIDSSANIQQDIANVSPQVASTTEPAFSFIDGIRNSAANVLDNQIATTKAKVSTTPKPGIVAGASIGQDAQIQNPATGFWYWLYTAYLYLLEALRWLIGNAGVFYPIIAIAFLYILWRAYRRFRRPY